MFTLKQVHKSDVKAIIYCERLGQYITCSKDGSLLMVDADTFSTTELLRTDPLVGCVEWSDGIVVAAANGVLLSFDYSGQVEQLALKCADRPSSLYCAKDILLVGDWDGNLYQYNMRTNTQQTHHFESFLYEERMVPNGVYSIGVLEKQLLVGLSSGHLAIGSKGQFNFYKLHEKAVRSITVQDRAVITASNDGRVLRTDLDTMQSTELQSNYFVGEYIFAVHAAEDLIVHGGTGMFAEAVYLGQDRPPQYFPTTSDIWCILRHKGRLILGLESGALQIFDTARCFDAPADGSPILDQSIPYQRFTSAAVDLLPLAEIRERYSFESLQQLGDYLRASAAQCGQSGYVNPINVCYLAGRLSCVLAAQDETLHVLGHIEEGNARTQPQLNPVDGKMYDISYVVDSDADGRRQRLYMNIGEDVGAVARRFLAQSGMCGGGATNEADYIVQISEFIEKNAPKTTMESVYRPDNRRHFDHKTFSIKQDMQFEAMNMKQARGQKGGAMQRPDASALCDLITVYPQSTAKSTAQKAFTHLEKYFGEVELEGFCRALQLSKTQIDGFKIEKQDEKAIMCVVAYALENNFVSSDAAEQNFIEYLFRSFCFDDVQASLVFSIRALAYMVTNNKLEEKFIAVMRPLASAIIDRIQTMQDNDDLAFVIVTVIKRRLASEIFGCDKGLLEKLYTVLGQHQ